MSVQPRRPVQDRLAIIQDDAAFAAYVAAGYARPDAPAVSDRRVRFSRRVGPSPRATADLVTARIVEHLERRGVLRREDVQSDFRVRP